MTNTPNWTLIESWKSIEFYLGKKHPTAFLLSSASLQRLGTPIIKAYQNALDDYVGYSVTVECQTPGQALNCMYHGIKNILYVGGKSSAALKALSGKTSTHFIEGFRRT